MNAALVAIFEIEIYFVFHNVAAIVSADVGVVHQFEDLDHCMVVDGGLVNVKAGLFDGN